MNTPRGLLKHIRGRPSNKFIRIIYVFVVKFLRIFSKLSLSRLHVSHISRLCVWNARFRFFFFFIFTSFFLLWNSVTGVFFFFLIPITITGGAWFIHKSIFNSWLCVKTFRKFKKKKTTVLLYRCCPYYYYTCNEPKILFAHTLDNCIVSSHRVRRSLQNITKIQRYSREISRQKQFIGCGNDNAATGAEPCTIF